MFQYTEPFVSGLQTQLEQSRLREAELLGALKEMQDKVLDLEKVGELDPSGPAPLVLLVLLLSLLLPVSNIKVGISFHSFHL